MSTSRNVRSFPANSELHRSKHPPVQYERRQNISSPPGMVLQHLVFDKGDLKGLHVPCEPGTSFQTPCPGMNMVSMKASPNNPAQYCCQYTRCASCRCSYCLSTMPAEKNSCLITEEGKPSMVVMPLRGELYTITDGSSAERHELIFNEKIVMEQLPCFVDYALWRHYLLVMFSKDTVDSLESRNQLLVVCLSSLTVEMVNFNVRRHWRSLLRWDKPGWKISTGPSAMILWAREPGKEAQVVVYCRVADEKPGACATSPIRRSAEESLSCEGEPSTSKQRSTPEPPRQEEPDSLAARIARTWPSDQGENGDGSRKRRRGRNATLITITGAIEEGPALPIAAPGSNLLCVIAECPRPAASSTHSKLRREIVLRRTNEGVPPQLKEERLFREVLKLPIESRQGKGAKIWGRMKGRDIPPNPETHKGRRIEEMLQWSCLGGKSLEVTGERTGHCNPSEGKTTKGTTHPEDQKIQKEAKTRNVGGKKKNDHTTIQAEDMEKPQ
ncbi:hypothetical protein QR680_004071 [Steinernema hermaphroditum]|uniref:Uncharacterized protein n=1 Tax=Steinernema hermaphroditum TaxID=289476 RepID=A0AA39HMK1_9BILA|nr:hypothetical protein QR680_004071 [Steinernema hermaphroditum]